MSTWTKALDYLASAPWTIYVLAPLLGLVMSLLVTQWVKLRWPRRWRKVLRRTLTQVIAFLLSALPPFALLTWYSHWVPGVVTALVIGAASPFVYDPVAAFVAHRWPWFAKSLDPEDP